jgi:hypothetical protein
MNKKRRIVLGAIVAPLSAPVLYLFFVMLFVPDWTPKQERTLETALLFLAAAVLSSYVMSFLLGAPIVYLLKRFRLLQLRWVIGASIPFGIIGLWLLYLVAVLPLTRPDTDGVAWSQLWSLLATGAILGSVIAVTFCAVSGITRQADRAPRVAAGSGSP